MATKLIGYEAFLPIITAAVRGKEKGDTTIDDAEFKAIVAVVFRDAFMRFIKETKLYRSEIAIDFYAGVYRYELIPPENWYIEAATALKSGTANVPPFYDLTEEDLTLYDCCPEQDINRAVYVEVALVPERSSGICQFDSRFIDKYYDAILALMEWKLAMMPQRDWRSLGSVSFLRSEYIKLKNKAIKGGTDSSKPAQLKYKRMSDVLSNCTI